MGQLRRGFRLFTGADVPGSENLGHGPAGGLVQRPARHFLGDQIEKGDVSRDVGADDGFAYAIEGDEGALLFREQGLLHELALDGVAQGAPQAAGLYLSLDQVVLGAFLQRLRGQRFIVQSREHHQRNAGRGCMGPSYRTQTLGVGQPEVEQDDVDGMAGKMDLRLAHGDHVRHLDPVAPLLIEHLPEQPRVAGIVFDQEEDLGRSLAHASSACSGNLTFVSQKSLMLFTRASNSSSCTGLDR